MISKIKKNKCTQNKPTVVFFMFMSLVIAMILIILFAQYMIDYDGKSWGNVIAIIFVAYIFTIYNFLVKKFPIEPSKIIIKHRNKLYK